MTAPERAVLSEAIQGTINGRRVRAAVLLTFKFDPGFFEEEVLPVLFDIPASQSPTVRLLQLEDALKMSGARLAVYYDPRGIMGDRSARLDARRIPIRHRTGYFHPKNLFALVESQPEEADGEPQGSLIVATMSANLTEDGWWRNVEVCHIEEVQSDERCGFRDDLFALTTRLRQLAPPGTDHAALEEIRGFLRQVEPYERRSASGALRARLYVGPERVVEFLRDACGSGLDGLNLEVISPYFDESEEARPLLDLVKEFRPAEVRVLLPRADDGTALCSEELYRGVRRMANCRWGRLAPELLKMGKGENVASRRVHAKVYRFFGTRPRREVLFVGSVNLTSAAHGSGGNLESAFLVEPESAKTPDWWLSIDRASPTTFAPELESDQTEPGTAVALALRYHWDTGDGSALWDDADRSPQLAIEAQGSFLFGLSTLPPRTWQRLTPEQTAALVAVLPGTSFVQVRVEGHEAVTILVQEEGLSHKPSLLMTLSAAEILRSWSLLTPEQRAAFIEDRLRRDPDVMRELGIANLPLPERTSEAFFDRFAGIFHAFGCLMRSVDAALKADRESEAVYRLFGRKYDSLSTLLDRVLASDAEEDDVTCYVTLLCARQILDRLRQDWPQFLADRRQDLSHLERRLDRIVEVRDRIDCGTPEERARFFDWFDRWFLALAEAKG